MRFHALFAILAAAIMVVSGCIAMSNGDRAPEAASKCQQKCLDMIPTKMDFARGPCLDDALMPDWVCDMAHSPRQAVDDDPANQCLSYGKTARHFVEVNENCRIITVV